MLRFAIQSTFRDGSEQQAQRAKADLVVEMVVLLEATSLTHETKGNREKTPKSMHTVDLEYDRYLR